MPSKKKKYNARFPAGRIKKIMQTDEDVGKVAQAVPVIISRTLELFVESLLTKSVEITNKRNAKTLSTSHVKQCILAESRFDFLKDLVKNIPDISHAEERESGQTMSADSSPNANRYVESANTFGDPGPSNTMRHPRRTHKKDERQSSDSESDREPPAKRTAKNAFGNGRNLKVSANFDDELNAFKQRMNQTTNRKASAAPRIDMAGRSFTAPATVGLLSPGENNDGEGNKQRLPNFYTETLQDTPEDDEKEKNADRPAYSSVIQPNPVYTGQKSSQSPFGFYKQVEQEAKLDVGTLPSYEKNHPYIVSFGKNSDPQLPMYHIDLSHEDRQVGNEPPFTPTLLSQPRTPLPDFTSNPNAKKTPPPLATLNRSYSSPENLVLNYSRPSRTGDPALRHTAQNESKSRLERSSHSIDSSGSTAGNLRKNEPPSLLPINLVSKASIAPLSGTPLPSSRLEIDEDYDT